jgi:ATP adenylyltransferase/5',5'''-P-1,P-4-tetraphosphate phosphorylase II
MKELGNSDLKNAYNLIFTEKFILIVIRSKESTLDNIPLNAMGFSGSILLKN